MDNQLLCKFFLNCLWFGVRPNEPLSIHFNCSILGKIDFCCNPKTSFLSKVFGDKLLKRVLAENGSFLFLVLLLVPVVCFDLMFYFIVVIIIFWISLDCHFSKIMVVVGGYITVLCDYLATQYNETLPSMFWGGRAIYSFFHCTKYR